MEELEKLAALVAQEFLSCLDETFDRLMEPEADVEENQTEEVMKPLTRVAGRG